MLRPERPGVSVLPVTTSVSRVSDNAIFLGFPRISPGAAEGARKNSRDTRHRRKRAGRAARGGRSGGARGKAPTTGRTIYEVSPGERTDFKCFQRLTFTPALPLSQTSAVPISGALLAPGNTSRYERERAMQRRVNLHLMRGIYTSPEVGELIRQAKRTASIPSSVERWSMS